MSGTRSTMFVISQLRSWTGRPGVLTRVAPLVIAVPGTLARRSAEKLARRLAGAACTERVPPATSGLPVRNAAAGFPRILEARHQRHRSTDGLPAQAAASRLGHFGERVRARLRVIGGEPAGRRPSSSRRRPVALGRGVRGAAAVAQAVGLFSAGRGGACRPAGPGSSATWGGDSKLRHLRARSRAKLAAMGLFLR
jgi:hypothetical protein